ncbi:MAG: hypothetical protein GOV01_04065 [Candidatus Altiarchaeota archaeon]|nr:hypothetical protein [Candidatus Altiarchaeota archaeon]
MARRLWLEKMLEKKADVIAGNFEPIASGFFEKVQSIFVKRSAPRNPSSRSIMFKKACWKKVGGYPEHLYTGEDTLFNAQLEEAGCKFKVADEAIVRWRMRSSPKKWIKQFYLYGKGDGKAGIGLKTTYGKKVVLLIIGAYSLVFLSASRPRVLLVPFVFGALYGLFRKFSIHGLFGGLLLPVRYLAYLIGFHSGVFRRK